MAGPVAPEFRGARRRLIETLMAVGIKDLSVLRAFELTSRHLFVPTGSFHRAYEDSALPIGDGQTISQPSVHARYLELLRLTLPTFNRSAVGGTKNAELKGVEFPDTW